MGVDVNKQEKEIEVKTIVTLQESIAALLEKFPGLVHIRVPICNSASPNEVDFDTITAAMVGSSINTPVILNDQVGLSRATTGSVAACLFKEFQINASFEGLVETVPGMDLNLLKMDRYAMDMKKDALFCGEFEVIKELVSIPPDGEAAKRECDKVIDKNGPAKTGGTGIKQLRENIAESKLSYEIMDDAAQVFLKSKIIWFNMRQEPTVYINGEPVCARPPNKIGEYAELGNVTSKQLEEDEAEFVRVCEGQMKA